MSDQETLFPGMPPEVDVVARFTVPGEPVSKARARFTGYGSTTRAYTPARTHSAEVQMAIAYRKARGHIETNPEVTFGVAATFYNGTRQRRDVDNMLKLVLDSLNGVAWMDDNQVIEVVGRKRFTERADAHTEVVVYRIGHIDRLRKPCEHCGKEFVTFPSIKDLTRFCSPACRKAHSQAQRRRTCKGCGREFLARGTTQDKQQFCTAKCHNEQGKVTITCPMCGTAFRQYRSWAVSRPYCSKECTAERARRRARERRKTTSPGTCRVCGGGTSRKEYVRCDVCRLAGKEVPA